MYTRARRRALRGPVLPAKNSASSERLLLAQSVAAGFQYLRIGAAVSTDSMVYAVYGTRHIGSFESAHGKVHERYAYNNRNVAKVRRTGEICRAEYGGFHDLFVPVLGSKGVEAVIMTGPFANHRTTSVEILERWRWLTGRQGDPLDPEFSSYIAAILEMLTFTSDQAQRFERWVTCFAELLSGHGNARESYERANALLPKLEQARFIDRVWLAATTMVDEKTEREWLAPHSPGLLAEVGLSRLPEHVLFGLITGKSRDIDPVGEVLRRDEFQRACVVLAHKTKRAICGKVGDHGLVFLISAAGSRAPLEREVERLAERAHELARQRFGLSLHLGASIAGGSLPLAVRYEHAMSAADRALAQGKLLAHAERGAQHSAPSLRGLCRELGSIAEERPNALGPSFDRYVQAVAIRCGYRLDLVRAYLEMGLDEATRAIRMSGVLDEKSYEEMCRSLERSARSVTSVHDLSAAYRSVLSDVVDLVTHPARKVRDRGLRRAVDFIHRRFAEPVSSAQVAKLAGFAPAHFCRLFKEREGLTFEKYVRGLRIERAKQLLVSTDLSAERVGQLSGFALRPYFHRAFKQAVGTTPSAYRQAALSGETTEGSLERGFPLLSTSG